ncbi:MAG: hypothetical protein U5J83_03740 [Bryobacterales bacterium]|nr:hypothetical protein [Bryobacterales bacterium]
MFLHRFHSFALKLGWLAWPILGYNQWPKLRFKERRGVTREEHQLLVSAEKNDERRATEFSRSGSGSVTLLPRVLPYPAWLRQCWQELQFHAILSGDETFRGAKLLNDSQEEMLWERTLRGMGAERRALFLDDTVQACLRSASLVDQYNISLSDEAWRIDEESAVFDSWHSKLREECRSRRLVRTSRLPVFLAKRMEQLASLHGVRLILAGFDEPMPAQLNLLLSAAKVSRDALLLDSR